MVLSSLSLDLVALVVTPKNISLVICHLKKSLSALVAYRKSQRMAAMAARLLSAHSYQQRAVKVEAWARQLFPFAGLVVVRAVWAQVAISIALVRQQVFLRNGLSLDQRSFILR